MSWFWGQLGATNHLCWRDLCYITHVEEFDKHPHVGLSHLIHNYVPELFEIITLMALRQICIKALKLPEVLQLSIIISLISIYMGIQIVRHQENHVLSS